MRPGPPHGNGHFPTRGPSERALAPKITPHEIADDGVLIGDVYRR
ncbi:hypothetical protein [Phenylobacterium sp.]